MAAHEGRAGDCGLARDVILRRRTAELQSDEADFLGGHLLQCSDCREFQARLDGVFDGLDTLGRLEHRARAEVRANVLKGVRRLKSARRSSARIRPAASRRVGSARISTRKSSRIGGRRRARSGWVRVFAAAAVAAGILAACLVLPRFRRRRDVTDPAVVHTYVGYVRGERGAVLLRSGRSLAVRAGDEILAGDRFETGDGVQLALFFGDGSVAVMNGGGSATVASPQGEKSVVLDRGDLFVNVKHRPGQRFAVNPGRPDQVLVVGTRFELSRSAAGTVLRVAEGAVSFGLGERSVQVTARLSSRVDAGGSPARPVPVTPEDIAAWRTNTAPTAADGSLSTEAGAPLEIVLAGDDAERDRLSFEVLSGPEHGELTGEPPQLTYVPAEGFSGRDTVEFRAFDGRAHSEPATLAIHVRPLPAPPSPSLMVAASGDRAPVTVIFDASNSKVAAPPAKFLWDFGDGESASGAKAEHVFEKAGSYTVKLTVTDRLGRSAERTTVVRVLEEWERRSSRPAGGSEKIGEAGETVPKPAGHAARPDKPDKPDKPGKPGKPGKEPPGLAGTPGEAPPGQVEKPDKPDKPGKPGKPSKKPSSKPARKPHKTKPEKD